MPGRIAWAGVVLGYLAVAAPAALYAAGGALRPRGRRRWCTCRWSRWRPPGRGVDRVRAAQRTAGAGARRGAAPGCAAPGAGPGRPPRCRGARGGGRGDGAGRGRCGAADGVAGAAPRRDPQGVRAADRGLVGVAGGAAALRHAAAERGRVGGGLRPRPRFPARRRDAGDAARRAGRAAAAAVPAAGGGAGPGRGHGAARDGRRAAADGGGRGGVVRRAGVRDGRGPLRHLDDRPDRRCGGVRGGAVRGAAGGARRAGRRPAGHGHAGPVRPGVVAGGTGDGGVARRDGRGDGPDRTGVAP